MKYLLVFVTLFLIPTAYADDGDDGFFSSIGKSIVDFFYYLTSPLDFDGSTDSFDGSFDDSIDPIDTQSFDYSSEPDIFIQTDNDFGDALNNLMNDDSAPIIPTNSDDTGDLTLQQLRDDLSKIDDQIDKIDAGFDKSFSDALDKLQSMVDELDEIYEKEAQNEEPDLDYGYDKAKLSPQVPSGSPIIFKLDANESINSTHVWPDQCVLWQSNGLDDRIWMFDTNGMGDKCMNVRIDGGYSIFFDTNNNDIMDGCKELLCDFNIRPDMFNHYQVIDFRYNSNNDNWLNSSDDRWNIVKVYEWSTGKVYDKDDLPGGILLHGIDLRNFIPFENDFTGIGQYTDCYYDENHPDYVKPTNWEELPYFIWINEKGCDPITDDHLRAVAWSSNGVIFSNNSTINIGPTYDFIFSPWSEYELHHAIDYMK